jgi:hypothetical protein
MKCDDIRRLISDDLDGAAGPAEQATVREHLAACDGCRQVQRQWQIIDDAVKAGPAGAPQAKYWQEYRGRLQPRLRLGPQRVSGIGSYHAWGWAAAALLLVALGVAVVVAAGQARRASEADEALARVAAAGRPAAGTGVVLPAAQVQDVSTDMKLFHEIDLTFEGGVKWVATDGRKIDFGVSRELGAAPAVTDGPDRVAVVTVSVRRMANGQMRPVNQARIVGRSGCRADFTAQAGGLEFSYECLPLIRSDRDARLRLVVGLGKEEGNGYGAASADVDFQSGQSGEVARVVSGGATYAIDVSLRLLPVQGQTKPVGA